MEKSIRITNISVVIKRKQILHNIDCELSAGEVVGLIGPNGAGKTTLMKTMLGLIKTTNGSIEMSGKNITGLIEQPGLYPFMTGLEHLELFSKNTDSKMLLDSLIQTLDLNEFINKKTKNYSLGMKQRLGIAIALQNEPAIVILDEPMNGLDPHSVKLLKETIRLYRDRGTTFLISSHILSELEQIVDRVFLLKGGYLVGDVKHPEQLGNFEEALLAKLAEEVI